MGINVATVSGNLGKNPEIRFFEDGKSVTTFSIAVAGFSKGDKTVFWLSCKAWNKVGQVCADYLTKGNSVTVSGRLGYEDWQDQSGEKRGRVILNVTDVQLPPKQSSTYQEGYGTEKDMSDHHDWEPHKD